MTKTVTASDFRSEVLESSDVVLVDFFAPWCGPCQALLPVIEEVSTKLPEGTKIVKVNIDESPDLAGAFEVMSIPTLIVFKNGEVKDIFTGGGLREQDILDMLKDNL